MLDGSKIVEELTKDWEDSGRHIDTGVPLEGTRRKMEIYLLGRNLLAHFNDAQLEAELKQRKDETVKKLEAVKIEVICPICDGKQYQGYSAYRQGIQCSTCKGTGKLRAIKC